MRTPLIPATRINAPFALHDDRDLRSVADQIIATARTAAAVHMAARVKHNPAEADSAMQHNIEEGDAQ